VKDELEIASDEGEEAVALSHLLNNFRTLQVDTSNQLIKL
jgi:hypothetical protein